MRSKSKYCILLTACINPQGMSYTSLLDKDERWRQYEKALLFYLKESRLPVVFVENTEFILPEQFQRYIDDNRLEYITFNGNTFDRTLGKGYGEALMMKYAFDNSTFLKECEYVVKITGRLMLNNLSSLLLEHKFFHHNSDSTVFYFCMDLIDSRCFVSKTSFLKKNFFPKIDDIDDSRNYYFEHCLDDCLTKQSKTFLFCIPQFEGISGTTGQTYSKVSILSRQYWRYKKINFLKYIALKNGRHLNNNSSL